MPRSAASRVAGFRAEGIVRILTAADPDEVLTAMEALGIQLTDEPGFFAILENLVGLVFGPLGDILDVLDTFDIVWEAAMRRLRQKPVSGEDLRLAIRLEQFQDEVREVRARGIFEKDAFQERIEEAKKEAAAGQVTATI